MANHWIFAFFVTFFASSTLSAQWTIETIAGTGAQGFSGDGGPATQAQLDNPFGVVRGPDGCIWFCEYTGKRIRRIRGPDGDPLSCKLARPHGIFVDSDGAVYVGDSESHKIRVLRKVKSR